MAVLNPSTFLGLSLIFSNTPPRLFVGHPGEVRPLREELPYEPVRVLDRRLLPGVVRLAEVEVEVEGVIVDGAPHGSSFWNQDVPDRIEEFLEHHLS